MVLTSLFLAFAVLLIVLLSFLWWWGLVFRPATKALDTDHPAPLWNAYTIQFSIFAVLAPLFLVPKMILGALLFPPSLFIAPVLLKGALLKMLWPIWLLPTLVGGSLSALVFVGLWMLDGKMRQWALLPALCVGLAVFRPYTNHQARVIIQTSFEDFGGECLVTSPFFRSVEFAGAEFQWELHAITIRNEQVFGWSYGEMSFYLIPERAPKDGNGKYRECMAQLG